MNRAMITKAIKLAFAMIMMTLSASPAHSQSGSAEHYVTNFWWPVAKPENQGMSSLCIDVIQERLAAKKAKDVGPATRRSSRRNG